MSYLPALGRAAGLTLPPMDGGARDLAFSWLCAMQGWPERISLLSPCCCPADGAGDTRQRQECGSARPLLFLVVLSSASHHLAMDRLVMGTHCHPGSQLGPAYPKVMLGLLFLSFTLLVTLCLTHWYPRVGLSAFCATVKSEK